MPTHKANTPFYLLGLVGTLASTTPALGYPVPNITLSTTALNQPYDSLFLSPHAADTHNVYPTAYNVVELTYSAAIKRDNTRHNATAVAKAKAPTNNPAHPVPSGHPAGEISIQKGQADGADRRRRRSHTDSDGVTYNDDGEVTNVPLGAGDVTYMPFGGIYDVPSGASTGALSGSFVMMRAMALSIATALAVYWVL